ncbi:MAG: hypothetical protein IPK16_24195 [Anaerolineales bacterium]|nr:hypothetical protein [Anaerolineales bacterium]
MAINLIHQGLANAASLFLAILTGWALVQFIRNQPLGGSWFGAAVIGEVLLLAQFLLGWVLYFQGFSAGPRPWIHILYGAVAIITLPAAYTYFSKIDSPRAQTLAMVVVCAFLWGILQRSGQVIYLEVFY